MTKEELQAIRTRCMSASPGPWHLENEEDTKWLVLHNDSIQARLYPIARVEYLVNAEFVAHARKDVKDLLDERDMLRKWIQDQADAAKMVYERNKFSPLTQPLPAQERILRELLEFIDGKVTTASRRTK